MKILLVLLFSIFCLADNYKVGDKITFSEVKNQFDKKYQVLKDTKKIIISSSKSTGKIITKYMIDNKNYQERTKSLIYINIESIPSFIFNTFMLSKLQKRNYSMGLLDDEELSEKIPTKDEHLTILYVDNNIIKKIEFKQSIK